MLVCRLCSMHMRPQRFRIHFRGTMERNMNVLVICVLDKIIDNDNDRMIRVFLTWVALCLFGLFSPHIWMKTLALVICSLLQVANLC